MSPAFPPVVPLVIGALIALVCLILAFRSLRHKRLIDDLPTSRTQGAFIGLTELKGTAESETPLTSYLAGMKCVQYSWEVKEHWSRTVHETYTDSQGHTQHRTRQESGWTTVASGGEALPFYLKDDTGVIRICPQGAKIENISSFFKECRRDNPLYYGKGPMGDIANSDHLRQFVEKAIPLHVALYVMGQARERKDVVAPEIAQDRNAPVFLISMRTEKQVSSGYGWWSIFWILLGVLFSLGSVWVQSRLDPFNRGTGPAPFITAALLYFVALSLGWTWMVYNSLVGLRLRVRQAWSQVEIQLKRRHDLIENLIPVVTGYRDYEVGTQQAVAELRTQLAANISRPGNTDLKGLTLSINAVIEKYPELKANESFLKLQRELAGTENRIALARGYFNEIATFYDNRLDIVPDRFVAAISGLRPETLMSAAEFERAPVKVNLAA